jgi:hypothetical protein
MSLSGRELLQHILDEAEFLDDRSGGLTSEEFLQDHSGVLRRGLRPGVGRGAPPEPRQYGGSSPGSIGKWRTLVVSRSASSTRVVAAIR